MPQVLLPEIKERLKEMHFTSRRHGHGKKRSGRGGKTWCERRGGCDSWANYRQIEMELLTKRE
jgi:hypothetical protein